MEIVGEWLGYHYGCYAQLFAEARGVPFTDALGNGLNAATMNYFFLIASVFALGAMGAWITSRFVAPKLQNDSYIIPEDMDLSDFTVKPEEERGLKAALIGCVLVTATINLLVGGLTSKWMLLGPIFIPMLYQVNPSMTPEIISAAFRVADSSTNIITPMMSYAGVILAFMRKYKPEMTIGEQIVIMMPYSIAFMVIWTTLLVIFFATGLPMGF